MIFIRRNIMYTQGVSTYFCLHIGTIVIMFGFKPNYMGPRLELFTPYHKFRWHNPRKTNEC